MNDENSNRHTGLSEMVKSVDNALSSLHACDAARKTTPAVKRASDLTPRFPKGTSFRVR